MKPVVSLFYNDLSVMSNSLNFAQILSNSDSAKWYDKELELLTNAGKFNFFSRPCFIELCFRNINGVTNEYFMFNLLNASAFGVKPSNGIFSFYLPEISSLHLENLTSITGVCNFTIYLT